MKELSIKEKVRRYDKAIERAKKHYEECKMRGNDWFVEDIEDMFPELKENEDEKIKGAAIEFVRQNNSFNYCLGISKEKVLDWLEKQGEKDEEILILKDQIESLHAAIKAIKETHRIKLEKFKRQCENNMGISEATKQKLEDSLNKALEKEIPESCNEFLDEQGEQKPADVRTTGYWHVEDIEQKSAWSEEDENAIQVLKDIVKHSNEINENIYTISLKEKLYNWLKSLKDRVQPQQKQEWSEEDVNFIEATIGLLNLVTPIDAASWGKSRLDCVDWLKSLRPQKQWRPSDKQINALDSTLQYSQVSHNSFEHLNSLFNDLKKLREQ